MMNGEKWFKSQYCHIVLSDSRMCNGKDKDTVNKMSLGSDTSNAII